jgi:hypothetical protein
MRFVTGEKMSKFNVNGVTKNYRKDESIKDKPLRDTYNYITVLLPKWKQEHLDYLYKVLPDLEDLAQHIPE